MSRPFFYCAELSRRAEEEAFGTASVGETWLLLEYRAAWGARPLHDSALSTSVKVHLTRLVKSIPRSRLLFIKQDPKFNPEDRMREDTLNLFVVHSRELFPSIRRFRFTNYEQLTECDVAMVAADNADAGGELVDAPLYLVCTHGRRDKCCAKFGFALYKSLRGQPIGEHVWQSSHVGGDRFAANLLCFPHGLFYAHVTEATGAFITGEYAQSRLTFEGYRGRACYPYPVQSAEFFIRRESGLNRLDALRYLRHERMDERNWLVSFTETGATPRLHEAHIAARPSGFQNYITCGATEERRVIQYALEAYRVTDEPAG